MVPRNPTRPPTRTRAPRARGDGPAPAVAAATAIPCSPRTRGWSRAEGGDSGADHVLPAHAGMVPAGARPPRPAAGAPRARGDGPPGARPDGEPRGCSPRTRGWSQPGQRGVVVVAVLPAHAGMVPQGDRPRRTLRGAPRARGDGPPHGRAGPAPGRCSPRTRGWSRWLTGRASHSAVLPAHAGMVLTVPSDDFTVSGAPRARGDGPALTRAFTHVQGCSPRTRGWSRRARRVPARTGAPAHAGMVPGVIRPAGAGGGAPRARGDGPTAGPGRSPAEGCSPRHAAGMVPGLAFAVPHAVRAHRAGGDRGVGLGGWRGSGGWDRGVFG